MSDEDFGSIWDDEPTKYDHEAATPMEVIDLTICPPSAIDNAQAVALDMLDITRTIEARHDERFRKTSLELPVIALKLEDDK
jgi:hypothetical protein